VAVRNSQRARGTVREIDETNSQETATSYKPECGKEKGSQGDRPKLKKRVEWTNSTVHSQFSSAGRDLQHEIW